MYSRSFHRVVPGRVDMGAVTAMVMALVVGVVEGGMGPGDLSGRMCAEGWRADNSGAREAILVEEVRSEQCNEWNWARRENKPWFRAYVSALALHAWSRWWLLVAWMHALGKSTWEGG